MPTHWKHSLETFALILRHHGLDPDAVDDVARAWSAFQEFVQEFVQEKFDGIEPAEDDGDGFIVQWGRSSGYDDRCTLGFTRQFAVSDEGDGSDEFRQPHLWHVELELIFADAPAWSDPSGRSACHSTGFDFDPIGPERAGALARITTLIPSLPQVGAMWRATPVASTLRLEPAD